ncbi:MAG: GntR family transcriptional regulator [Acidobacteriia bacterium]|nr:GntR family transcriptional regulator [Terriglobia bacterium]
MTAFPMPVILVDWGSEEPVYAQIARQIRARIASGELPAGTVLPSVRSIASDLGVNLNTVARAYRILEDERFVVIRDRAGARVASPARDADGAVIEGLNEELGVVLARMRQAGLSTSELRRRIERELSDLDARGGK